MKRPSRILLFTVVGILLLAFGWFVLRPREPSYQGKTLTEWLTNAYEMFSYPDACGESVRAVRHIGPSAIPTLLNYASAKDSRLKRALLQWNDTHPTISLPLSSQFELHILAERGLYILGPDAKEAVPELVRLLKHDDDDVRTTAAACLGGIGPAAQSAVPDLIMEFEREMSSTNQNFAAAYALAKIGPSAQAAIPSLKKGLTNNSSQCRRFSEIALINIHAVSISPWLDQLKDTTNVNQWTYAMMVVRFCGTNAIPAVPLFISALNCTNESIQARSLSTLGWLHERADISVPAIASFLTSKNDYSRQNAIDSLRGFGKAAKPAIPALLLCLDDQNITVREYATNALREIDPEAAVKAGIK